MMFCKRIAVFASAFALAGSIHAGMIQCPDINEIKVVGINMAGPITPKKYITYSISTYKTNSLWGFVIAPIYAESNDSAISIASEILQTMNTPGVPKERKGESVCLYNTGRQGVLAAAIKTSHMISPSTLMQYIQE